MGVLLYGPQERQAVLAKRLQAAGAGPEAEAPQRYRLDGVLRRPEGAAWIANGVPRKDGEALDATGKRPRVAGDGVLLDGRRWRVGETFDAASGEIAPAFSARIETGKQGGRP